MIITRALAIFSLLTAAGARAQPMGLPSPDQITQIVRAVSESQLDYMAHTRAHFRYHLHRVDTKEDTTRDLIESADGNIGRMLLHNGQPLTAAEDEGERHRLRTLLGSGELKRHQREEKRFSGYGTELVRAMPQAMLFTLTPGQPQLPEHDRAQLVLDYVPNPSFQPRTTVEGMLSGLSGRLWVDAADHHLVRLEIQIDRNLDLALGVLARVYSGGTVEYDQRRIAEGQYAFTHIRMHLLLRELMVRTVPFDSDLTATAIQSLPGAPSAEEAIAALLQDEIKTR